MLDLFLCQVLAPREEKLPLFLKNSAYIPEDGDKLASLRWYAIWRTWGGAWPGRWATPGRWAALDSPHRGSSPCMLALMQRNSSQSRCCHHSPQPALGQYFGAEKYACPPKEVLGPSRFPDSCLVPRVRVWTERLSGMLWCSLPHHCPPPQSHSGGQAWSLLELYLPVLRRRPNGTCHPKVGEGLNLLSRQQRKQFLVRAWNPPWVGYSKRREHTEIPLTILSLKSVFKIRAFQAAGSPSTSGTNAGGRGVNSGLYCPDMVLPRAAIPSRKFHIHSFIYPFIPLAGNFFSMNTC